MKRTPVYGSETARRGRGRMPDLRSRRRRHIDAYGRSAAELPRLAGSVPGALVLAGLLMVVIAGWFLGHRVEQSASEKAPAAILRSGGAAPQPLRDAFADVGPRLAGVRRAQAGALAARTDRAGQARAAATIAEAYRGAERELAAVEAGAGEPKRAMVKALRDAAAGYEGLAAAARKGDRGAYTTASAKVDAAERELLGLAAASGASP